MGENDPGNGNSPPKAPPAQTETAPRAPAAPPEAAEMGMGLRQLQEMECKLTDLRASLGHPANIPEGHDAKRANANFERLKKSFKHLDKKADEAKIKELVSAARIEDVFELQSRVYTKPETGYTEMAQMFMQAKNLVPTHGEISFVVDLKGDQRFEMNIGLGHILPPTVFKVEVVDARCRKRVGERKIVDGRLGYYDENGYIPIFSGYRVSVLETRDAADAQCGRAVKEEKGNYERLRQEYEMVKKEEKEYETAVSEGKIKEAPAAREHIRLQPLLDDNSGNFSKEQTDFGAIQRMFHEAGMQWDEKVWIEGGAALRNLQGRGAEILGRPRVMEIFNLMAHGGDFAGVKVSGGYRANLDDIPDVAAFAAHRSFGGFAPAGEKLGAYEFLRKLRQFNGAPQIDATLERATDQKTPMGRAKEYLDRTLASSDKAGREIYRNSVRTFAPLGSELPRVLDKFSGNIERLNRRGWAAGSFGMIVDGQKQVLYLLYKEVDGRVSEGAKMRVSMGRRDRLGSNVEGSNGTPRGMLEWYASKGTLERQDSQRIGENMRRDHCEVPRGRAGITTRWLRIRGLEAFNGNSDGRGIFFHGGGYMDGFRGGFEQSWVPRSRGCIVTSNADTLLLWSFIRQNFLAGQKMLCDVAV